MSSSSIQEEVCPECLGTRTIWNGTDYDTCNKCHGLGTVVKDTLYDDSEDELEEDFLPLNDDIADDVENDDY